jgi:GTP pyrophosphokinase
MVTVPYTRLGSGHEIGLLRQGGEPLRLKCELMACCTPVPGDHIYGLLDRRERRMRVHRGECEQLKRELAHSELVALEWDSQREGQHYPARVGVVSLNRVGLLFEVLRYLSQQNVNIGGAQFDMSMQGATSAQYVGFELLLEVGDIEELKRCIEHVKAIPDVIEVQRQFRYTDLPGSELDDAQPPGDNNSPNATDEDILAVQQPTLPFVGPGGTGGGGIA